MAPAGLWENWCSPSGDGYVALRSSRPPNELCAEPHNRMPVVLGPETWPAWLGEEPADPRQIKALLVPFPSAGMTGWPVSPRLGSVKNNDPGLIEPVTLAI
jgi:putative SOS response-associated peptidase YedK